VDERAEREQHQPEVDADPAEISAPAGVGRAEDDDADQHQDRRHLGDVEGQDLGDQRGSDIGAEHDRECRRQADRAACGKRGRHQPGRSAALQHRGHREAGKKGKKTSASPGARQSAAEPDAQLGTETALDAGADHMRAPEKEPDIAAELQKGHGARHFRPTFRATAGIATGSYR